jgi:hypothetical protein
MNKFGTYLQYLVLDVGFGVISDFFLLENFYNLMTGGKKKRKKRPYNKYKG